MANSNNPTGFKPHRHLGGGVIRTQQFQINTTGTTGYNDTIRRGDLVSLNADGTIELTANNSGVCLGVFNGVDYTAADGSAVFAGQWTASTSTLSGKPINAQVYVDPMITYEVQATTATQADVGLVCDVVAGTGSSVTEQSGSYIDQADTTNGVARILNIINRPDNETGSYAKVEVLLNSQLNVVTSI